MLKARVECREGEGRWIRNEGRAARMRGQWSKAVTVT